MISFLQHSAVSLRKCDEGDEREICLRFFGIKNSYFAVSQHRATCYLMILQRGKMSQREKHRRPFLLRRLLEGELRVEYHTLPLEENHVFLEICP